MSAAIAAIEYFLPESELSNDALTAEFAGWTAQKIQDKTGIVERRVAGPDQCASDLAFAACERLFSSGAVRRDEIDFLILCTQSPDYLLPTTACIILVCLIRTRRESVSGFPLSIKAVLQVFSDCGAYLSSVPYGKS